MSPLFITIDDLEFQVGSPLSGLAAVDGFEYDSSSSFGIVQSRRVSRDASESGSSSSSEDDDAVIIEDDADNSQTESSKSSTSAESDEDTTSGYESSRSVNSNISTGSDSSQESTASLDLLRRVFLKEGRRIIYSATHKLNAFERASFDSIKRAVRIGPARADSSLLRFFEAEIEEYQSEIRDFICSRSRESTLAGPVKHILEESLLQELEEWILELRRKLRHWFTDAVKSRPTTVQKELRAPQIIFHHDYSKAPVAIKVRQVEQVDKQVQVDIENSTPSQPKYRFWKSITISRDQTAASNFARELLRVLEQDRHSVLQPSGRRINQGHPQTLDVPLYAGPTATIGRITIPPSAPGHGSLRPGLLPPGPLPRIPASPPPPPPDWGRRPSGAFGSGRLPPVPPPSFFPPGGLPRAPARKYQSQRAAPGWLVESSDTTSLLNRTAITSEALEVVAPQEPTAPEQSVAQQNNAGPLIKRTGTEVVLSGQTMNMPPNATAVSPMLGALAHSEQRDLLPEINPDDSESIATESLTYLIDRVQLLEAENQEFKKSQGEAVEFETVHIIIDDRTRQQIIFVDEPTWGISPRGNARLQGHFPIYDLEGFLEQKHDVAFVVLKYYDEDEQWQDVEDAHRAKKSLPRPKPSSETIRLLSTPMIEAVNEFLARQPNFSTEFPDFNAQAPISAPYLFWYHYRSPEALDELHSIHQLLMRVLTSWIDEQYGHLYARVDDQFQRGVTSAETLEFLFKPGDVMIWKEKNEIAAAIVKSRPTLRTRPRPNASRSYQISPLTLNKNASDSKWRWQIQTWQYYYDGSFIQKNICNQIIMQSNTQDEVPISELTAYPLKYAGDTVRSILQARGDTFWKCRYRRLVSYKDEKGVHGINERFMVDFETYKELHSDSINFKMLYMRSDDKSQKRMDPEVMASETPPAAPEIYVFPRAIMGYNLRTKKWVDLEVDLIQDVAWNKKSFEHLVVDIETKELVQALVTHQIEREQNTDVIENKGNGLIILLHGGPGTGKTFTAESVAEMAEKPLFRVTCGDIGTKPEDVEKYLESVLYLGKIWGCVVLLDEADVFLEQRSLTDLERNALVSVFLRVLEYYEGILILTSNRVGTFDEAFKSRIQLALHYHNLTEGQRWKIWKNFLTRLKTLETGDSSSSTASSSSESGSGGDGVIRGLSRRTKSMDPVGIDFDDVECYLGDLAKYELNGRQIRNSITTARQLAKFKGEKMSYHHLRHVITVSGKFDAYLKTVQEGFSDDQVARGDGIR
ncbi:hypothetical protein F4777DRAFT_584592 [Nemania sp. FL0916]|nr:hypothetical protein F4777DRAFT_584592 [Nemania sp. FL0916]